MIKAVILDCFGVLYQTPRERRRFWGVGESMGLSRNQELIDYAQKLRPAHKLAVLSNCAAGVMDHFFSPRERRQLFDEFIVSAEVGVAKPQPEAFYLTCQRLGVKPDEAIFIDDIPGFCHVASEVGMHAIHYESNEQIRSEVEALLKV